MNINSFFVSDLHLNHKNICRGVSQWDNKSTCRDFDTVDDMNTAIIDSINNVVAKDDILYHLGDFNFGDKKLTPQLRERINCRDIRHIYGNHDHHIRNNVEYQKLFTWCKDYHEERIPLSSGKKQFIVMCHYPIISWNENGKGSWMIFGHCHNNLLPAIQRGKMLDVGWDCWQKPLDMEEIRGIMEQKEVAIVDGHNENTNYG